MSEVARLARSLAAAAGNGRSVALATVVSVEGSSYRRAGAWMLSDADGAREGLISGGCLEADVAREATGVLKDGAPRVLRYDTRDPDDLVWGLGMGCRGVVHVRVERLEPESLRELTAFFARVADCRERGVLAIPAADPSDPRVRRAFVTSAAAFGSGLDPVQPEILAAARRILQDSNATAWSPTGESADTDPAASVPASGGEAAFEVVLPRIELLLCGAGEDALPLAELAVGLDWRIVVADHRSALARPERFPAARVLAVESPRRLGELLRPPFDRTAAIVMSHNVERDVEYAAALLPLRLPYLGLLGPRARGEQVLRAARGLSPESPADPSTVFAPVGLDVGSETPREIALAAVAEIAAVLAGRAGGHLREVRATGIDASGARAGRRG